MSSFLLSAKINLVEWEKLKCNTDLCLDIKDENKLVYNSKKGIYGIKLKHLDCIPNIIGGELAEYQFSIDRTAKTFEANYKTEPIPPGVGILIEFDAPIYQSCLDQIVFYEEAGWVLSHDFNPVYGCMDDNACNFSPRANNNDGSCDFALENYDCDGNCISDIDCSGECGGGKVIDKCNVCGGNNLSCADCAGTPNGDAVVDNCGTCDSDSNNDCIQDCAGTWGGILIIDECNVCGGDNLSCADCAGTPNGDAVVDNCGTCDSDSNNDCIQDCAGTWGGTLIIDECNVCGGDNLSCADCAGTPNGNAFLDDCSICSSGITNHIANSDKDCFGVCFGNAIFDCANICGGKTIIDCFGICDGTGEKDRCGVCDGDNTSCGADYLWPTNASKTVTAFFGEERPHRYHAGIDIRTYGRIGDELFATSDGYIKKITISTKGYGKAIYLQLDDGNTALYAHLNSFTKEIDSIVKALQNKHNKYSLYYTFEPEEFRFKKGDVIGYSGDTGTISGPHIHYELRDSLGRPYNPLYEYNIIDSKSPVVNQIAFIPLDFKTTINELSRTQTFNFNRSTSNIYELKDTIAVNGKFGLGINVIDKVNQQPFSYGIHKIELYIDDKKTYEVSYDIYNYSDKRYIYNERDYQLKIDTGKTFYRLFSDVNKNMLFINPKYASEYVFFQDNDYHEFKIVISDFNNNKVFASGTILNKKLPIINTIHDNQNIMFDNILNDEYEYKFYNTGKNDLDQIFLNNNAFINDKKISWPLSEKPFSVLKIDIKSKDGTKYLPQYIQIIQDEISEIKGDFNLKHYKHGLILEFQTDNFSKEIPRFTYEDDGYRKELNMYRTNKNLFESKLITPLDFSNYKNIEIHFETIPEYVFNYKTNQILTKPKEEFKLLHNGGQTILKGNKYTFDDTTIVWVEEKIDLIENETATITNPIFIGPIRLNFKKSMELIIKVPNRNDLDYSSIYKYDEYNNEWKYIPSVVNRTELSLVSDINSGGIYAVIKEKKPPAIDNIYPGNNASYYQNDFREIIFNIYDSQSGIKDESNIKVQIDEEKPLIFEYNSYRKQVTYKLHKKLLKGKHQLTIEAYDNVGNKINIINKFYIKENKE